MVLKSPYLLEMENKLSQLMGTYLGNVSGVFLGFKKVLQRGQCGAGYPDSIFALALSMGTEPVALD